MPKRAPTKLVYVFIFLFLLGCGGAFGKAMRLGDDFMKSGQWDLAAQEYERAVALKPGDAKAQEKLARVRVMQAEDRVNRARPMLANNDAVGALKLLQEAVRFDPNNAQGKALFAAANDKVLDRAEARLADDPAEAFALTTLVLEGLPGDPRASALDQQAREALAARSYERALSLIDADKHGVALVELAAAQEYVPGYRDSLTRTTEVRRELGRRLVFHAVVGNIAGDASAAPIAREMSQATLAGSFGEMPLLAVVATTPSPSDAFAGIRLGGIAENYRHDRRQHTETKTCRYLCGKTVRPNEQHATLRRELGDAQARRKSAEAEVSKLAAEVASAERAYDDVARDVDRAELEVDRSRLSLERCRQNHPQDPGACGPEENKLEADLKRLGAAQARLEQPQAIRDAARSKLAQAQERLDRETAKIASYEAQLRATPATIEVERTCDHRYTVTRHDLTSTVDITIRAEAIRDTTVVIDNQKSSYRASDSDATFPPEGGRCAEVAAGDPLQLKAESALKADLATQASANLRRQILAQYERYRRSFLERAQQQAASGLVDDAVDSYLRYLLATPRSAADAPVAREYIKKEKRLTDASIDQLL